MRTAVSPWRDARGRVGSPFLKGFAMSWRRRTERGAAAVEFAVIFIPFTVLLFGFIEFGYYFWTAETTGSSARETARRVVVGDCWTDPQAYAVAHGPRVQSAVVSPSLASTVVGDKITVTVTSDSGLIDFIPGIPNSVTRAYEARMEVENSTGAC